MEVESGESPAGLKAGEAGEADASADTDEPIFIVLYIIQIYYFTKIINI